MRYWFGVACLFVATLAAHAVIWTALPLAVIGIYFLVSGWVEEHR